MKKSTQPPSIPLAVAARAVGRKPSRLRQVCIARGIGTMVTPRMRLLTPDDLAALTRAFAQMKVGRPKNRKNNG